MTIEMLEEYRGIASGVEAIEREINTLYNPVRSPNGRETSGSFSGTPSDPTAQAARRIIKRKETLKEQRESMYALLEKIEDWLISCDDTEVVSIIRWHYLLGLNWKQTNMKVYGYPDYQYARKKIMRYFKKEK